MAEAPQRGLIDPDSTVDGPRHEGHPFALRSHLQRNKTHGSARDAVVLNVRKLEKKHSTAAADTVSARLSPENADFYDQMFAILPGDAFRTATNSA